MTFPLRLSLALLAALFVAFPLAGCGDSGATGGSTGGTSGTPASEPGKITVTHILIGAKHPRLKATRSMAEAQVLSKSLMGDIANGRPFQELVDKFTDDRDGKGSPNTNNGKPGSYDFAVKDLGGLAPEFAKAIQELPVGKITPEPVKTEFGYHIIRRDK